MSRDAKAAGDVVRADALTKLYRNGRGVSDLSLSVGQGEVLGFLGPNGAGKTTTIRLMLDLIRPTSGSVTLFGRVPGDHDVRGAVGYLPGDLRLYGSMTGREHMIYFAHLRSMSDLGDAVELCERLRLDLDEPVRQLSRGNRQKVGLVLALMHRPRLLVLDEPTTGLDPLVQQTFHDLVGEAAAAGSAVFISSHVLPEVQHVAGRVALIRDGRLILVDSVESIRSAAVARVEVTLSEPPAADAFASIPGTREVERRGATVVLTHEGEIDPLIKRLAQLHVVAIDSSEADLEDVFLRLYEGDGDAS
jgi:ABC-2 type transport system ATP-binding protein